MNTKYKLALFSKFSDWLSNQGCYSVNTEKSYLRIINSFLNYLDGFDVDALKDIDNGVLLNFIIKRGDTNYAKSYVRLRESALDLFFAWAKKNGYCQHNPITVYRKDKLYLKPFPKKTIKEDSLKITVLTQDEQQRLISSAAVNTEVSTGFTAIRNECIITLILNTALYAEELISLSTDDLDLESNHVDVVTRAGKERRVAINLQTHIACKGWLDVRTKALQDDKLTTLFLTEDFKPITKRHLYKITSTAMRKAGINKDQLGPEALRQTAIYNMFRNGLSLEEVQKITGITTLMNLQKYQSYEPE